jgi:hypothetical protein
VSAEKFVWQDWCTLPFSRSKDKEDRLMWTIVDATHRLPTRAREGFDITKGKDPRAMRLHLIQRKRGESWVQSLRVWRRRRGMFRPVSEDVVGSSSIFLLLYSAASKVGAVFSSSNWLLRDVGR